MPDHLEYFVVTESVSIDRDTNRVSLFNVVEEVVASPVPLPVVAVSGWNLSAEEQRGSDLQAGVRITKPGGQTLGPFPVNFTGRTFRHRIVHRFAVPFDEPGEWLFEILMNGRREASHRITVHPAPTPPQG